MARGSSTVCPTSRVAQGRGQKVRRASWNDEISPLSFSPIRGTQINQVLDSEIDNLAGDTTNSRQSGPKRSPSGSTDLTSNLTRQRTYSSADVPHRLTLARAELIVPTPPHITKYLRYHCTRAESSRPLHRSIPLDPPGCSCKTNTCVTAS